MQNAKLDEVKKLMTDAEKIRKKANELDEQARKILEAAKQKHDKACKLDKQAREKLDKVYEISEKSDTDEEFEQKFQKLEMREANESFNKTQDLINWTKNQAKEHNLEVDFEGYVVKVNPESNIKKKYKI